MRQAAALFGKAAEPGRVKTRLAAKLTPEEAAEFHTACVRDCWTRINSLPGVEPRLFSDRPWLEWEELAGGVRCRLQRAGGLGERMYGAFEDLEGEGFERTLILGSDSPTLPIDYVREAFDLLETERDAVLGPTEDGGYYAVGCRIPRAAMFDGVEWSEETTFEQTVEAFERVGYRVRLLPRWWDVDLPEDLDRLRGEPLGAAVAAWFESVGRKA